MAGGRGAGAVMIRWLFFDIGSTLVDESLCDVARIADTVRGSGVSETEFLAQLREFAAQNLDVYKLCLKHFSLKKAPWRSELERLYPAVPELLKDLSQKYALGIIANQNAGLEERLREWGILPYFRVIVSSCEAGVAKPESEIFERALARAECLPDEACMIGDRLDNDIMPAQKLGMQTVWVRQGMGGYGNAKLLETPPTMVVSDIAALRDILLA